MKRKYELFNPLEKGLLFLMFLVLALVGMILFDALESCACPLIQNEDIPTEISKPFNREEIEMLERVCMSESGISSFDEKQANVTTILNRLDSGKWGSTLEEVINYPNAYCIADNGEPTAECKEAVRAAIKNRHAFPSNMYYFRLYHYHSFGYDYCHIGDTYYSLNEENATWLE